MAEPFRAAPATAKRGRSLRSKRTGTFEAIEKRLTSHGTDPAETKEILDHLIWSELNLDRRNYLLNHRDHLWRIDFQRVREVLVKLFADGRLSDATALIQRYFSVLLVEDPAQRRRVAENARYILQLIEKTGKGMPMLRGKGEGDMYIELVIETPVNLTARQKELLREFEKLSEDNNPEANNFFNKVKGFWDGIKG